MKLNCAVERDDHAPAWSLSESAPEFPHRLMPDVDPEFQRWREAGRHEADTNLKRPSLGLRIPIFYESVQ